MSKTLAEEPLNAEELEYVEDELAYYLERYIQAEQRSAIVAGLAARRLAESLGRFAPGRGRRDVLAFVADGFPAERALRRLGYGQARVHTDVIFERDL